jgi:hypothetical protein
MSPIPLAGMQPVVVEIADFLCPEVDEDAGLRGIPEICIGLPQNAHHAVMSEWVIARPTATLSSCLLQIDERT